MDTNVIDGIVQEMGDHATRRTVVRLLGGAAAFSVSLAFGGTSLAKSQRHGAARGESRARRREHVAAQRRGGGKKLTICYQGRTRTIKKSKLGNFRGATRGTCVIEGGTPQPDAACPGPGGSILGTATANARFAQTFTARASGKLVTAQVTLIKDAGTNGDYVATINSVDAQGVPTNTVLASTSIPNANAVVGESQATFNFPNPAAVIAGTVYALVISRTGPDPLRLRGDGSNRCIGGAFDSPNQTSPFLSTGPAIDFDFTTFVRA